VVEYDEERNRRTLGKYAAYFLIGTYQEDGMSRVVWPRHISNAIAVVALIASGTAQTPPPADVILTNARVYTVNSAQPWADAVAIQDGRIIAVGKAQDIDKFKSEKTQLIDAGGRVVLPGFTDCHVHFMSGSVALTEVVLDDAKTVQEYQQRVKDYAAAHPDAPWILGRGWTYPAFGTAALPDKKYLDAIVPDRPVFLEGFDGHTYWANSKALELAHISKDTPNPPNGVIVRDPATGEATGALKEAAQELVSKVVPALTREQRLAALRGGLQEVNKDGVVRIHSAGGDFEYFDLYNELRSKGELTARFYIAYFLDPPELSSKEIQLIEGARKTYHDDWLSGGAVKTMLDGVVESHTAAMKYADTGKTTPTFWKADKYTQAMQELDKRGFQLFTHAIGDDAVDLALNAFENMQKANHTSDMRPRVEHIETVKAADIPRFGKLGVIASMQPLHAYPDDDTLGPWLNGAGKEREPRAWAWKSIKSDGGHLAFGSDWPVVTINPWPGVEMAVTRQTTEGKPPGGFVPAQRLTVAQAIEGYTIGAAYAGHREKTEGSIEPGKLADLIVLSQDPFSIPANQLSKTEVLLTIVGGKVVYRSDAWGKNTSAGAGK
jgi:predicted amidohydrolase YtcJ